MKLRLLELDFRRGLLSEGQLQSRGLALFAHARRSDDIVWRRVVAAFRRIGDAAFRRIGDASGEAQEPQPCDPGWLVEQSPEEVPVRLPQQEQAR